MVTGTSDGLTMKSTMGSGSTARNTGVDNGEAPKVTSILENGTKEMPMVLGFISG